MASRTHDRPGRRADRRRIPELGSPRPDSARRVDRVDAAAALEDYRIGWLSRHVSDLGRREVMAGRAQFGIFGDGKEIAQVAMSRAFEPGDFRSGYYRDQTMMFALGLLSPQEFFAGLYAHVDVEADPSSGGRATNPGNASPWIRRDGSWMPQTNRMNSASDISPTGGQMPRAVGLAQASTIYRNEPGLEHLTGFSQAGREVTFVTIGNASAAGGVFWEAVNAIGVLGAPAVIGIWDDGYGISVPNELQHTKGDLTAILGGFRRSPRGTSGFDIYTVRGWDYPSLIEAFRAAAAKARANHIPAIVHVTEMTQPQGHSTSGSHERYKSVERLAWEEEHCPLRKMRAWLITEDLASGAQLDAIERETRTEVRAARDAARAAALEPIRAVRDEAVDLMRAISTPPVDALADRLSGVEQPSYRQILETAHDVLDSVDGSIDPAVEALRTWRTTVLDEGVERYRTHLLSESDESPLKVAAVPAIYPEEPNRVKGHALLRENFDALLERDPRVLIFGEDTGALGGVNQGTAGLQQKYGAHRVFDTGIREATIVGQAIGLAMRGLRPIAEIQYLDYILYAITSLADDLATLRWRSAGGQAAPAIIRTRGHRLLGIWHAGSPMGALCHLLRGIHLAVPRNMTQAAGMYNTLMQGDDPGIVIERLNAYRLEELLPANLGSFTVPLGVPETLRPGTDVTLVTYASCVPVALDAADRLSRRNVSVEVIDVQTLLPFDIHQSIKESVARTGRLVVLDEDVPGGASAYLLQQITEVQGAFWDLQAPPITITGTEHRPPYGVDGGYFSKPDARTVVERLYSMMIDDAPAVHRRIW